MSLDLNPMAITGSTRLQVLTAMLVVLGFSIIQSCEYPNKIDYENFINCLKNNFESLDLSVISQLM